MKKFSTIQHALMAGKKLLLSVIAISISATVFAIDWDSYAWLGDGAGGGAYSEMYKVAPAEGQNVVNIQKPGFAAKTVSTPTSRPESVLVRWVRNALLTVREWCFI